MLDWMTLLLSRTATPPDCFQHPIVAVDARYGGPRQHLDIREARNAVGEVARHACGSSLASSHTNGPSTPTKGVRTPAASQRECPLLDILRMLLLTANSRDDQASDRAREAFRL